MNALATHWLPSDPPRPCPDILTADEAVMYLRLDQTGVKDPRATLERYRARGLIPGVMLGKCVRYRRLDLDKFVERHMNDYHR